jgi:hypothetical protein
VAFPIRFAEQPPSRPPRNGRDRIAPIATLAGVAFVLLLLRVLAPIILKH